MSRQDFDLLVENAGTQLRAAHLPRSPQQWRALLALTRHVRARSGQKTRLCGNTRELIVASATLAALVHLGLVNDGSITKRGQLAIDWMKGWPDLI